MERMSDNSSAAMMSAAGNDINCKGEEIIDTSTVTSADKVEIDTTSTSTVKKKPHKKRKASKGKLKKLWRRATGPPPGITSRSEWLELIELHSDWKIQQQAKNEEEDTKTNYDKPTGGGVAIDKESMTGQLPGPSIGITQQQRDYNNLNNWQISEGSDHRDILMNLLFSKGDIHNNSTSRSQQQPKKKKKRKLVTTNDEENNSNSLVSIPPLPSWATITNLASIGGVAVIDLQICGGDTDTPCPLMPSQRIADSITTNSQVSNVWSSLIQPSGSSNSSKVERKISAACKVNLFQGDRQVKCISDVLMFQPLPLTDVTPKANQINGDSDQFFQSLKGLLLIPKQLRKERFPIEVATTLDETVDSKAAKEISEMFKSTMSQSKGDTISSTFKHNKGALELVSSLSVNIKRRDEEDEVDTDDISISEYYVKSYVDSSTSDDDSYTPKIYAIDCEMVKTSSVFPELARVSVIMFTGDEDDNEKTTVVLDELVKPRREVLDYLTQYSGISASMLTNVETRIEDIQLQLLGLIDSRDILVGHSLENDLRALRFVHCNIIDTSVIFRGNNGRKFSLKHLSNVLLQKKIQNGCGTSGHCSIEDAKAALILAVRRARRGESFRLKENSKRQNIISTFQKISREASGQSREDSACFAERNQGSCVCIGDNDWVQKYAQSAEGSHHVLGCEAIMNSMAMAIPSWLSSEQSTKRAGFLWASLQCEDKRGEWKNEVKKLDEILEALIRRAPYHTPILILIVCQQNYKKTLQLKAQRKSAQSLKASSLWTTVQEEEYFKFVDQARSCEAIWICANNS